MIDDFVVSCLEIDLDQLGNNIRSIRSNIKPETLIMAMIKADAYGQGAVVTSNVLIENGVDRLGVASLYEALELRKYYKHIPLQIMGYVPIESYSIVLEKDIIQTVYNYEQALKLSRIASEMKKNAVIHIKINTNLNRLGFNIDSKSRQIISRIYKLPNLYVEGIFTHFASADNQSINLAYEKFCNFIEALEKVNVNIPIKHCSGGAAILGYPKMNLDMIRPGSVVFGLQSSGRRNITKIAVKPIMTFKSKIIQIRTVKKGEGIGYSATYIADNDRVVAIVPLGYADGLSRYLSNNGRVLVNGIYGIIVGRICMDQCMIDITKIPSAKEGDEVVFIGVQGKNKITIDEVSRAAGTNNDDIICGFGKRLIKVYKKQGKIVNIKNCLRD
ncbi:alanine racemase [Wukongibacter sp. M2B1]|uniref:alanine racemase n=1 Tax=Wukongibacter sp. M2B1 TaxID=3088895 RepID=UPI003D7A5134